MWAPSSHNSPSKDIIATTGDYLRLWGVDTESNAVEQISVLNNNKMHGKKLYS